MGEPDGLNMSLDDLIKRRQGPPEPRRTVTPWTGDARPMAVDDESRSPPTLGHGVERDRGHHGGKERTGRPRSRVISPAPAAAQGAGWAQRSSNGRERSARGDEEERGVGRLRSLAVPSRPAASEAHAKRFGDRSYDRRSYDRERARDVEPRMRGGSQVGRSQHIILNNYQVLEIVVCITDTRTAAPTGFRSLLPCLQDGRTRLEKGEEATEPGRRKETASRATSSMAAPGNVPDTDPYVPVVMLPMSQVYMMMYAPRVAAHSEDPHKRPRIDYDL